MTTINLTDFRDAIGDWHDNRFPGKTNADVGLKLGEECGEVQGAQVRIDEIAHGTRAGEATAALEHLAKELGDAMIVWLTICHRHGLDPERVLRERWAVVEGRQWVTPAPRGDEPAVGTARPCARPGFHEMWDGDRWVPICDVCGDEAAYCDGTRHSVSASATAGGGS